MLNFYIDIQNVYNFKGDRPPLYTVITDAYGDPVVNPNDTDRYLFKTIKGSGGGTILPTVGFIMEF